ncbi:hypothetical protein [Paraburkholderia strydomiana]|uniref:hypothetical protein n=1 Tax=Paraburkholderia strydomiana TaxID=1245417 RepID=UPI0038B7EB01
MNERKRALESAQQRPHVDVLVHNPRPGAGRRQCSTQRMTTRRALFTHPFIKGFHHG